MIIDAKNFYEVFANTMPGSPKSGTGSSSKEYDIYFDNFSMTALNEMHRYSVDKRFYDHFEFSPFINISETKAYMEKLISRMSGDKNSRVTTYWLVRRKSDDYLIGTAGLIDLHLSRQSIEWGYGVDPELWGLGYILQIQEILKDYVFNTLKLNRIHGVTMSNNNKTIESILATGMKHEGIAKDHYCKDGIFIDGWRYGMTKKDYINQSKSVALNKNINIKEVITIVCSILPDDDITEESSMENSQSWDSLNHMLIMIALKEKLGIDLAPSDIADAISIKDIMSILNKIK
jgi:ribosomal-protein-alanine N-acetyltransferase